jgi:cell division protein FtsB
MPDNTFAVHAPDQSYYFQCDTFEQAQDWVKIIRSWFDSRQSLGFRQIESVTSEKLQQCQNIFNENGNFSHFFPHKIAFKPPLEVAPDEAERYIEDIRKHYEEYKKWLPFVNSLTLYAETQAGRLKGYSAWFLNKSKGVYELITQSQESVLKDWSNRICKAPDELEALTETMFYMEDLQAPIERYSKLVPLVDFYNRARREFQREEGEVLQEEKEALVAWIQKLKTYPFAV